MSSCGNEPREKTHNQTRQGRGESTTAATSKMQLFVVIVNDF